MNNLNGPMLAAAFAALGFATEVKAGDAITIATGSPTGLYYAAGDALCKAFSANATSGTRGCSVVASQGSASNVIELDPAKAQFGIVQSDVQYHAMQGRDVFAFVAAADTIRSVFSLHAEAFTVIVKRDSSFKRIDDLRGKRFSLGPFGTGTRDTGEALLAALGWTAGDKSGLMDFAPAQNAKALCGGQVDAVAYFVGHPSQNVQEVSKTCPIRFLALDPVKVEAGIRDKPYYSVVAIAGGLYAGVPETTPTLGVKATLVTLSTVPDETVAALTASAFEHLGVLTGASPAFAGLESSHMIRDGLTAPLHPGAMQYYQKKGWLTTEDAALNAARSGKKEISPELKLKETGAATKVIVKPDRKAAPIVAPDDGSMEGPPTLPVEKPTRQPWERDTSPF